MTPPLTPLERAELELLALKLRLAIARRKRARGQRPGGHRGSRYRRLLDQVDRKADQAARYRRSQAIRARMRRAPKATWPKCGARCRDGHACKAPIVWLPGDRPRDRCRLHGGLSTGPTKAGKAKLSASMTERWAAWRRGEGPKPGRTSKASG
jgi:hypothetical protein